MDIKPQVISELLEILKSKESAASAKGEKNRVDSSTRALIVCPVSTSTTTTTKMRGLLVFFFTGGKTANVSRKDTTARKNSSGGHQRSRSISSLSGLPIIAKSSGEKRPNDQYRNAPTSNPSRVRIYIYIPSIVCTPFLTQDIMHLSGRGGQILSAPPQYSSKRRWPSVPTKKTLCPRQKP